MLAEAQVIERLSFLSYQLVIADYDILEICPAVHVAAYDLGLTHYQE
ncbi:MAG: hypothetical protein AAFQ14_00285 [Cyanobacteria bacterium J06621_12]